jgi:hypothetical protein
MLGTWSSCTEVKFLVLSCLFPSIFFIFWYICINVLINTSLFVYLLMIKMFFEALGCCSEEERVMLRID